MGIYEQIAAKISTKEINTNHNPMNRDEGV